MSAARPGLPAGRLESAPGGFVPEIVRAEVLAGVLAGIGLGDWDRRVVGWLAGLDTATALTVASWIARARGQGRGCERGEGMAGHPVPISRHYR